MEEVERILGGKVSRSKGREAGKVGVLFRNIMANSPGRSPRRA